MIHGVKLQIKKLNKKKFQKKKLRIGSVGWKNVHPGGCCALTDMITTKYNIYKTSVTHVYCETQQYR